MTSTLFPLQYGFEVRSNEDGTYWLLDRSTFNNWGEVRRNRPFTDLAAAYLYAFQADEFKRGRRSTLKD